MIAYVGFDEKEKNWLLNSGIYMSKKFTVQYINEYGEKLFPDEEIAELDTEYVFYPKEKEGYISLQPEISGTAAENTTVTFEYCKICDDLAFIGLDSNGNETTDESLIQKYTVSGIGDCQNTWVATPKTRNGKDVTDIKKKAFYKNNTIEKLVISNNIEKIGESAFASMSKLNKILIDAKKNQTEGFLLYGCNNLKEVIFGENVSIVPHAIFSHSNNLEYLTFITEQDIAVGGTRVFEGGNIKEIKLNKGNKKYKTVDGILYTKDGSKLVIYPKGKLGDTYSFSQNLSEIGKWAFLYNINLKKLYIPKNVTINYAAFEQSNIEEISIDNLSSDFIFCDCHKLKKVICRENVSYLPHGTFVRCYNLETIEFNTEEDIGIGGSRVFQECRNFKNITVNKDNKKYKSVDGVLYTKDGSKLVVYPVGKLDEEYTLDPNIGEICSYVFTNSKVKTINYEGTMEEWNNVVKQNNWNYGGVVKTIHCTDGDISI